MQRFFGILLTLTMLVGMMPEMSLRAQAEGESYDLWVGGIRVTDENKDDVLDNADAGHSVNIYPGSHMTKTTDSGDASQSSLTGEMTPVVYKADAIPAEGEAEIETNWEWLYGKLSPGTYRITKILTDGNRNDPAVNIPAYPLMAQFIIAGDEL